MAGSNTEWRPSQALLDEYEKYVQHRTTQRAAAEVLAIHPNTVSKQFKRIEKAIYQDLSDNVVRIKSGQTETLRHIAMEAMSAWHDSKGEKVVVHERDTRDGIYRETTTSQSSGNSQFLSSALKALEDIRRIWGAESPKQIEVETVTAEADPSRRLEKISERMKQMVPEITVEVIEDERSTADEQPVLEGNATVAVVPQVDETIGEGDRDGGADEGVLPGLRIVRDDERPEDG